MLMARAKEERAHGSKNLEALAINMLNIFAENAGGALGQQAHKLTRAMRNSLQRILFKRCRQRPLSEILRLQVEMLSRHTLITIIITTLLGRRVVREARQVLIRILNTPGSKTSQ